ncbi:MAG: hypothetical protein LWX83_00160 [Anaerolineae bacterium]|nr:hypothetical protein [Anaerolineae bacterium]
MNSTPFRLPFNLSRVNINAVLVLGLIIIAALISFEMFNFTTTEYALSDLLGGLTFMGIRWSTILSIAFCGIDFAGIARLFVTGKDNNEPKEVWYLFGAWIMAAAMNAALTWWGVSIAVLSHPVQSSVVMDSTTLVKVVPVFVAIMIWVIRVLIIGTISTAGNNLLKNTHHSSGSLPARRPTAAAPGLGQNMAHTPGSAAAMRGARPGATPLVSRPVINRSMSASGSDDSSSSRIEPTYHRTL